MGHIIELTLDAIAHGGEAIGRHAGKAIFVPDAIPGERVRVEIVEEKERWARARLVKVLTPSPDRVTPPCPHFGPDRCEGCQWQHIAYERQAELKRDIVADQLRRLSRLPDPPVADTLVMEAPDTTPSLIPHPATRDESSPQYPIPNTPYLAYAYRSYTHFALTPDGAVGFPPVGQPRRDPDRPLPAARPAAG